jgi:hypothetical protein
VKATPEQATETRHELRLGVEGSAWKLFESAWLVGGGALADLRAAPGFVLPKASIRAVLRAGVEVAPEAVDSLWLGALRLEGCPLGVGSDVVELRPCVAVDAGAVGASAAGEGDAAFWAALAGHARVAVAATRELGLEAQAGVLLPLTRYEVAAGTPGRIVEKTKQVGLSLGLGATFRLP